MSIGPVTIDIAEPFKRIELHVAEDPAAPVSYDITFTEHTDLRLSAQYTAQESVGEELIGSFDTDTIGVKLALGYRGAVFTLAGTTTDDGAQIRVVGSALRRDRRGRRVRCRHRAQCTS